MKVEYKNNPNDLQKYLDAQNQTFGGKSMYQVALTEITSGRKKNHYIWYILPQLEGLGSSSNCMIYGVPGIGGAIAYLNNVVLKSRLVEICEALLNLKKDTLMFVMSQVDIMKVRSCITLFYQASIRMYGEESPEAELFKVLMKKYFTKIGWDELTLSILIDNGEIEECRY